LFASFVLKCLLKIQKYRRWGWIFLFTLSITSNRYKINKFVYVKMAKFIEKRKSEN